MTVGAVGTVAVGSWIVIMDDTDAAWVALAVVGMLAAVAAVPLSVAGRHGWAACAAFAAVVTPTGFAYLPNLIMLVAGVNEIRLARTRRLAHGEAAALDVDAPDDAAYGRVTNPERFQVVVDAARNLINDLAADFEVVVEPDASDPNIPYWVPSTETIRVVPREGAPLTFGIIDPPTVIVRAGEWGVETFPFCNCDGCDWPLDDAIEDMTELVKAVTEGSYEEKLTKRRFHTAYAGRSRDARLKRGQWKRYGTPGSPTWPPWPKPQTVRTSTPD